MRYLPHEAWGLKCFFRRSYEGLNTLFKWINYSKSERGWISQHKCFLKVTICGHYVFVPFIFLVFLFLFKSCQEFLNFHFLKTLVWFFFRRNGWQKWAGLNFQWKPNENTRKSRKTVSGKSPYFNPLNHMCTLSGWSLLMVSLVHRILMILLTHLWSPCRISTLWLMLLLLLISLHLLIAKPAADDNYTVEKIKKTRVRHGVVQYLVKWTGYTNTHNTWLDTNGLRLVPPLGKLLKG